MKCCKKQDEKRMQGKFISRETKNTIYVLVGIFVFSTTLFLCFREYLHTKLISKDDTFEENNDNYK